MGGGMEEFEMNRVRIEVYGSRYVISTPEDESYVRGLAKSLDEQLRSLLENNSGLTLNAVSYTHLDVYKRQISWSMQTRPITGANFPRISTFALPERFRSNPSA